MINDKFIKAGISKKMLTEYSSDNISDRTPYYGLPKEVKYCKRCIISNQRPSSTIELRNSKGIKNTIKIDKDEICSACKYADIKNNGINWEKREKELIKLCKYYRSKKGNYDCLIPGSGGKDSSFTAHILKYKYKMNPLTVTWTPHIYTEVGFSNLQKWIHAGFDNILFSPNGKIHRLLTKLAFLNLLHPFQPFIVGQRHIGPKFSTLYNIPLVFYGENQAEYGNNISEANVPTMSPDFYKMDLDLNKLFLSGVSCNELIKKYNIKYQELLPYLPADKEKIKKVGTTVHYLGHYLKWDPQECYYYASEHTGFSANTQRTEGSYSKYSSIDDRIDPIHYYTTFIKFGLGRASYDAAQEIRNKKITREEGIILVKKYDSEFPDKYFKEVLEFMGISEKVFWENINKGRPPHLWKLENGEWKLRKPVWKEN